MQPDDNLSAIQSTKKNAKMRRVGFEPTRIAPDVCNNQLVGVNPSCKFEKLETPAIDRSATFPIRTDILAVIVLMYDIPPIRHTHSCSNVVVQFGITLCARKVR